MRKFTRKLGLLITLASLSVVPITTTFNPPTVIAATGDTTSVTTAYNNMNTAAKALETAADSAGREVVFFDIGEHEVYSDAEYQELLDNFKSSYEQQKNETGTAYIFDVVIKYKPSTRVVNFKEGSTVLSTVTQSTSTTKTITLTYKHDSASSYGYNEVESGSHGTSGWSAVTVPSNLATDFTFSTSVGAVSNILTTNPQTLNDEGQQIVEVAGTRINRTITFKGNGNTSGTMANQTVPSGKATKLNSNAFAKTGYQFNGWKDASNVAYANQANITTSANKELTAQWKANTYTVTFNGNGSTSGSMSNQAFTYGTAQNLTANAFTKTGYTFAGWATSASGAVAYTDKKSVSNLTTTNNGTVPLYAKWTANTHTITYKANGGTGSDVTQSTTYDAKPTIKSNPFTRTGYTFAGWATSASGAVDTNYPANAAAKKAITGNLTLYAKWTPVNYTISYTLNGGTNNSANPTSYNIETATITLKAPTKTGYTGSWKEGSSIAKGSTGNKTFTAQWTANKYNVAFNGNGSTSGSMSNQAFTYDTAQNLTANAYAKTGHTFAGWATSSTGAVAYTDKKSVSNLTTTNNGTVALYAKWNANKYTVAFNGNGSTSGSMSNQSFTYGTAQNLTANAFSRTGYTFAGWATSASGAVAHTDKKSVSNLTATNNGTVTLYAKWNPITYTVKFNGNGSTSGSMSNQTFTYDTAQNLTANSFVKTGYRFNGWATSATGSVAHTDKKSVKNLTATANGTVNLYAQWVQQFTVTFVNGTGTTLKTQTVDINTAATAPANPTRTGYTFAGWDKTFNNVTGNMTVTAKWTANKYTVAFNGNGSTSGSMSNQSFTYGTAQNLTANTFSKTGYNFAGWATSASGAVAHTDKKSVNNLTATNNGTVTLYAQWNINKYTVAFNGNGSTGGTMSNQSFTYGTAQSLTANAFTKTGHTFAGWATSASGAVVHTDKKSVNNLTTTNNGTVTLYAKWTPNKYTVTFNGNGSTSGSMGNQSFTYGTAQALTANTFSKTGHTFAGWATSTTGAVAHTDKKSVSNLTATNNGTVTLYAKWTPNKYTVAFNGNGSTSGSMSNQSFTYGTAQALTANTYTKTGYNFAGWATTASGAVAHTDKKSVSNLTATNNGTVNLYAKWNANKYTVAFNGNGSTSGSMSNQAFTYGTAQNLTANAFSKTGYTFEGWATTASGAVVHTDKKSVNNLTTTNNGTVTLYAKWTPNKYTVAFNGNGSTGGSMSNQSFTYGTAQALTANAFSKTGYTFAGWATSATGAVTHTDKKSVSNLTATNNGTVTLYAKWTANTHTITYKANGGTGSDVTQSTTYDAKPTIKANPFTRTGYTFAGWATSSTGAVDTNYPANAAAKKSITGNLTLYAKWTPVNYTISYTLNGGTNNSANPTSYNIETATITLKAPTKTGYTGSWKEGSSIAKGSTGNKTFTAQWTANKYNVTFNGNGNTGGSTATLSSKDYGSTQTLTANGFTKTGYTFNGWNTKADGSGTAYANNANFVIPASNTTLYAQWKVNTYNVTFNGNGSTSGSTASLTNKNYNTSVTLTANAFVKTGHTFKNWNTKADGTGTSYADKATFAIPAGNTTLYAQWIKNTYNVTFNGNGNTSGSTAALSAKEYGSNQTLTANGFIKTGYTFNGWNTKADGTGTAYANKATFSIPAANTTLYAQWKANTYTVTFTDGQGKTIKTQTVEYGKSATLPSNPTRTGYAFDGWDSSHTNITANKTINAKWKANAYTVTFVDGQGKTITAQAVEYGKSATAPTNPTRTGYTFNGWDKAFNNITANMTVTAQWKINTYNITFNGNTNTGGSTASLTNKDYNSEVTLTSNGFTKTGYSFVNWNTAANGSGTSYANNAKFTIPASNTTLYAQWKINAYNVTFNGNGNTGGSTAALSNKNYNTSVTLTANGFSKTGYTFTGWNTKADGSGTAYADKANFTIPVGNTTLYAQWKANTYNVTFNGNGNTSGSTAALSNKTYNTTQTLTANGFVKTGYTFNGWNTKADGTGVAYANKASFTIPANNTTLYAQWKANTYTVTFTDGQGKTLKTQSVEYGKAATAPTNPTRSGYAFDGWDKTFNNITGNTTVNAKWKANAYTVSFVDGLGNTLKTEAVEYGKSATAPSSPTREGYDFAGWDKAFNNITANTTITAKWNIKKYTVTFMDGSGNTLKTESVEYGKSATAPTTPTRAGYKFDGWDKTFSNIKANTTVNAKWVSNSFTVTFTDGQGKTLKTEVVESGKNATAPANPTRTGYTFAGWDRVLTNITANTTINAKWNIEKYTVTFTDGQGKTLKTESVEYGKSATAPTSPTRSGYNFAGWDKAFSNITGNTTVNAKWTQNTTYTVTFVDGQGKTLKTEVVEKGKTATAPSNPTREGYSFNGWDKAFSNISANTTVTALWKINTYTVTFTDGQGKTLKTQTVEYGKAATAPSNPTRTNYTFDGWDNTFNNIKANITVNAKWKGTTYTATFTDGSGNIINTQTVNAGSAAKAPANPEREGSVFLAWDKQFNNITADTTINATWKDIIEKNWYIIETKAMSLFRIGTPNSRDDIKVQRASNQIGQKFQISRQTDGSYKIGTGPSVGQKVLGSKGVQQKFDDSSKWEVVVNSDNSFSFKNKATGKYLSYTKTGNDVALSESNTISGNNQKFVVKRFTETFTVTFVDEDGKVLDRKAVKKGNAATAPKVTKQGKTFAGWDADFSNVTKHITVKAIWK